MPRYDASRHDPPAPLANVTLRDIATGKLIADVQLLVDSGADVTLLPRAAVERLGVRIATDAGYELVGFDGSRSTARAVDLDMIFLTKAYRGRYLLIDGAEGVLGRDVLASVALLLDGPAQEWSEQSTRR